MKIKVEIDEELTEEEIIIRCSQYDEKIQKMESMIGDVTLRTQKIILHKENMQYYIPLEKILFFETGQNMISVHTADDVFYTNYKLYELEGILPGNFVRISKSAIVNVNPIFAINRNITSSSAIEFYHSHKQVFVSRNYYKVLKEKLDEKRMEV